MKNTVIVILGYPIGSKDNILQKRLKKGLGLARQKNINQIVVSGHGRLDEIEADYMKKWLRNHNFNGQIIKESASRDTIENLVYCSEIIKKRGYNDIIIVTSWFHAKRTRTIAEQVLKGYDFSISQSKGGNQELAKKEKKYQNILIKNIKNGNFKNKVSKQKLYYHRSNHE